MRFRLVMLGAAVAALTAIAVTPAASADPIDRYRWTEVTAAPGWQARAGLQAVELGGAFLVLGGRTPTAPPPGESVVPGASTIWSDVWRSRDRGATWARILETGGAHWPARAYFQAVVKDGYVYVLGGQDFSVVPNPGCAAQPQPCTLPPVPASTFFNDVWRSRDGATWERMTAAAPWAGRAGLSAVAYRGELWVLGGSRNDDSAIVGTGAPARQYFNDVWRSKDGRTWTRATARAPWAPRAGGVAAVKDGYLWLLGGEDGFICDPNRPNRCPPYFNDVWRSKDGKRWTRVTASAGWSPRPGHQCAVVIGRFVCFGGFGLPQNLLGPSVNPMDVWSSTNGRTWTKAKQRPWNATTPSAVKYDFDAFASRGAIFTFGGDRETFNFADPLNPTRIDDDVWRFAPPGR